MMAKSNSLLRKVRALEKRVKALEQKQRKRRIGFEYEGSVGGDMVQSTYYEADGSGEADKRRRG